MNDPQDLYGVLGVAPGATPGQIAHAYRALLRRHHPDSRDDDGGAAHDRALAEAMAAYATLRDPRARAVYDRSLADRASRASRVSRTAADFRADRSGARIEVVRRPARTAGGATVRDAAPAAGTTGAVPGPRPDRGPTISVGPVLHVPVRMTAGPGAHVPRQADPVEWLLRALGF